MVAFIARNREIPGLVQLYARLSNEASEPGHPAHPYFRERYDQVRAMWTENLTRLQAEGRLSAQVDPATLAVIASALVDGLQTQWTYDPELDMAEHLAYLLRVFLTTGDAAPASDDIP